MKQFSVITSVYKNDKEEFVRVALDSMLVNQSAKPAEIVLVQDGPVSENLSGLLSEYEGKFPEVFHVIRLEKNGGLGNALKLGVENAKFDIIARMDSDDIAMPDRFEKQIRFLEEHPDVDLVGGQITEFIGTADNIVGKREVPCDNGEIYQYMRSRCALNHPTVMFKRESVLNAGNDFSEIDMTARAILLLSGTGKEFIVFHPVNNHIGFGMKITICGFA